MERSYSFVVFDVSSWTNLVIMENALLDFLRVIVYKNGEPSSEIEIAR